MIKRVCVTGGAGYVGSALVPRLLDQGYAVTVLDRYLFGDNLFEDYRSDSRLVEIKGDISDHEAVYSALIGADAVIHLACISNDPSLEIDPIEGRRTNFDAFTPFVHACVIRGVKRFINASSSSVYGVKPDGVDVTEELTLEPMTDYALYKMQCEKALSHWRDHLTTVSVRPAALCGYAPRLRLDLVVNMFVAQALEHHCITVHGGDQRRALLHIDDMAHCYLDLLRAPDDRIHGKVWNVGCANMTVREIADAVHKRTGAKVEILPLPDDDRRSYRISSNAIAAQLGFVPHYTVDDAITDLIIAWSLGKFPNGALSNPKYVNVLRYKELMGASS